MNTSLDLILNDMDFDNDVDELFSHLEQFQPPADMVGRIMLAVNELPMPQIREAADNLEALA